MLKVRKKILLMLILSVLLPEFTKSQNIIYDFNGLLSEYSIIRNYSKSVDISFDAYLSTRKFSYIDRSTGFNYSFDTYFVPIDFKIVNEIVYFCGIDGMHGGLVVGWFKVPQAFFGNREIYYYPLPQSIPCSFDNKYDFFTSIISLEAVEIDGYTHLFLVGKGLHCNEEDYAYYSQYAEYNRYFIADVYGINTSTTMSMSYTMDYSGELIFDDNAITDNSMIVSGRLFQNEIYSHLILPYRLPTISSANQSIFESASGFSQPFLTDTAYTVNIGIFRPLNMVSITERDGLGFATTCRSTTGNTGTDNIVVNIYDSPTIVTNRFCFSLNSNPSSMELSFNRNTGSLYMLSDIRNDSLIHTNYPYLNIVLQKTEPSLYRWLSIDQVHGTANNVLSGTLHDFTFRRLWFQDNNMSSECVTEESIGTSPLSTDQRAYPLVQGIINLSITQSHERVDVSMNEFIEKCK